MLFEELLRRNLISEEAYNKCIEELQSSQMSEEKIIIQNELLDQEKLLNIKGELLNTPVFKDVNSLQIPEQVLSIIPEESAKYYRMVPLRLKDGVFEVGMLNPEDIKAKEVLLFLARQNEIKAKIYLISESDFEEILKKYRNIKEVVEEALSELGADEKSDLVVLDEDEKLNNKEDLLEDEAPIIKMVAAILRHAVEGKASDIHIEPTMSILNLIFTSDIVGSI